MLWSQPANPPIDMAGRRIGRFDVIEQSARRDRGAWWWCLCLDCRDQIEVRGTNLRKAERDANFRIFCPRCDEVAA